MQVIIGNLHKDILETDMTDEELIGRINNQEDNWIERKSKGVSTEDIRKTSVAFANSVSDDELAVLFIGVSDNGNIDGVDDTDIFQRKTIPKAIDGCYPAINYKVKVLTIDDKNIVAVIISSSYNKPHFAGKSFIRVGSESKEASEQEFEKLIVGRNSKARPLLEALKNRENISVKRYFKRGGLPRQYNNCVVLECTTQFVEFQDELGQLISANLEDVKITKSNQKLRVEIDS